MKTLKATTIIMVKEAAHIPLSYLIIPSRRRTISIRVSPDKQIIVKVPWGSNPSSVEDFIKEKEGWILKQLAKISEEEEAALSLGLLNQDDISKIKREAKLIIPERLSYYANKTGISYKKVFIRLQKSRWGSCSLEGNLNFNALLILMPRQVLDSVIVHELCHRLHMNHSKAFYDEVLKFYPDYYTWQKWLKKNGGSYLKRLKP